MAVENAELLRWQELAHQALGDFLAAAMVEGLPAIAWTIASNGAMTGTVDSLATSPAGMRAVFEAWAFRLGARPEERTDSSGTVHLYARFTWARNYLVGGALRAQLVPPMDDGGAV
ncbi:hypothetical protein SUDANB1_07148 [Streptomyces sp. enrichment culture]|uniref:hypothetical protein n=1 Tax=Streptomyces sp. enrichment culture TaxID=1795815 RepID=UPI003F54615A